MEWSYCPQLVAKIRISKSTYTVPNLLEYFIHYHTKPNLNYGTSSGFTRQSRPGDINMSDHRTAGIPSAPAQEAGKQDWDLALEEKIILTHISPGRNNLHRSVVSI